MKLYFLRHGIAEDVDTWKGDDSDRPLTREGCQKMEREAKAFAQLDVAPDAIITSPLVRAKQTAEIAAAALKQRAIEDPRLSPGFDTNRLEQILNDHNDADAVMLVGHEPDMSETIGRVIGGARARIDLKKGGLAYVEVERESGLSGELVWLLAPKVLVR